MKQIDPGSRVIEQPYARVCAATTFSLALNENDAQLIFGLLDTKNPEILRVEGRLAVSTLTIRTLHDLLGRSLKSLDEQLKARGTVQ